MIRRHFQTFGRSLLERGLAWWASPAANPQQPQRNLGCSTSSNHEVVFASGITLVRFVSRHKNSPTLSIEELKKVRVRLLQDGW
jgi:hypothetical protein